jgi:hypothetical protein
MVVNWVIMLNEYDISMFYSSTWKAAGSLYNFQWWHNVLIVYARQKERSIHISVFRAVIL